ncbi:MAG: hypothetical protein CM15mP18_4270 [Methanobacteriota archaeon]|nr:MAG: hypothetical protein CM15mP18_4270 [Euryarchaeota archaeon]
MNERQQGIDMKTSERTPRWRDLKALVNTLLSFCEEPEGEHRVLPQTSGRAEHRILHVGRPYQTRGETLATRRGPTLCGINHIINDLVGPGASSANPRSVPCLRWFPGRPGGVPSNP